MTFQLTADEQDLARALMAGSAFNPRGLPLTAQGSEPSAPPMDVKRTVVRAEALERMLRGLDVGLGDGETLRLDEPRLVHIIGVSIEGMLNLADLRGIAHEAASPILLECCLFSEMLDFRYARLSRLSLRGSRLAQLELDYCHLQGSLDLRHVAASGYAADEDNPLFNDRLFETPGTETPGYDCAPVIRGHAVKPCWVRVNNAHIAGDLTATGARLCCPMRKDDPYSGGGIPYALELAGTRIDGSVALQPAVVLLGGMTMRETKVAGSVWLGGAKLRAIGGDIALRCQSAEIGEHFQMRAVQTSGGKLATFCCVGQIEFGSSRIKGELRIAGGSVYPAPGIMMEAAPTASDPLPMVFSLWMAQVGSVFIGAETSATDQQSTFVHGGLYAGDAEVSKSFRIEPGAWLGAYEPGQAVPTPFTSEAPHPGQGGMLFLDNAKIGGDFAIGGWIRGDVSASRIVVAGGVVLQGAFKNLLLPESRLEKGLLMGAEGRVLRIEGRMNLDSARLGAPLRIDRVRLDGPGTALQMRNLSVEGSLEIAAAVGADISLGGARVSGSMRLAIAAAETTDGTSAPLVSLEAPHLDVGGSLEMQWVAAGRMAISGSRIHGDLKLLPGTRIGPPKDRSSLALEAEGLQVEGNVELLCEINGGISMARSRIDGELRLGRHPKSSISSGALALVWDKQTADPGFLFDLSEIDIRQSLQVGQLDIRPAAEVREDIELKLVRMARGTPVSFYPGWNFVDVHVERIDEDGNRLHAVAAYLVRRLSEEESTVVVLDGKSPPIHRLNATPAGLDDSTRTLQLQTIEQATDYLRFFCRMVWGEEGAFQTIESLQDLPAGAELTGAFQPTPIIGHRVGEDIRFDNVAIFYGGYLFRASFVVKPTGMVEMLGDTPMADLRDRPRDRYVDGLRLPPLGQQGVHLDNVQQGKADSLPVASFDYGPALIDPSLRRLVTAWEQPSPPRPFEVNLIGLRAASLDDGDGKGWWRGWRQPSPAAGASAGERLHWLNWQPIRTWGELHEDEQRPLIRLRLDGIRFGRTDRWPDLPSAPKPDPAEDTAQAGLRAGFGLAAQAGAGGGGRRDELGENHPEKTLQRRKRWLMLQYSDKLYEPADGTQRNRRGVAALNLDDYNPQPYEELARALFAEGQFTNARDILIFRSDMDNWLHVSNGLRRPGLIHRMVALLRLLVMWPFSKAFAYGLKPSRSLAAFAFCIVLGWLGIFAALRTDAMVVETTPIAIAIRQTDSMHLGMVLVPGSTAPAGMFESIDRLDCGGEIDPLLYAFDVFVPLLDLRQETQCRMSDDLFWWNLVKSLYAALGWIVTSITVLAVTGVLRLRSQD